MGFFSRLGFSRSKPPSAAALSQLAPPPSVAGGTSGSQGRGRRELLRVVLRDTLHRHGIPSAWLDAEVLLSTSRSGERGIHWRLVVKHPDSRLATCTVALQNALIKRLTTFDPLASAWLTGMSWQYALPDDAPYPAMPHPSTWKEAPAQTGPNEAAAGGARAEPDPADAAAVQAARDTKADLDELFAARDADFHRHASHESTAHEATQPMFLGTEPAKL